MIATRGKSTAWVGLGAVLLVCGLAVPVAWHWRTSGGESPPARDPKVEGPTTPSEWGALSDETRRNLLVSSKGEVLTDLYQDMTAKAGIDFTYHNGQEAGHYGILESLGGGIGLIDYDGDGLLDIVVTGGGYYDGPDKMQIKGYGIRLYKNLGNWQFKDVTAELGLDKPLFFTHGVAVADYDRDGWPDLLITGWGRMALYHNEPDGKGGRKFVEVSKQAGLPEGLWTTSAAWADLDGDGYPDLYVCQYVDWSIIGNNPVCPGYSSKIKRDVCPPKQFTGLPHHVFRNNGNGTFTDVSTEAGVRPHTGEPDKDKENGKGLGVVIGDADGDGKPDIFVANDTVDKFFYLNRSTPGKIRLEEVGLQRGVARDEKGVSNGSMGIDAGDPFGTGRLAMWCTNYENEMHGLYRNSGDGWFTYCTQVSGIAAIGQAYVGFGTAFNDIDNHGWEDLIVINGHVIRFPQAAGLKQRPVLLRNKGKGLFADITVQGGSYFRSEHMGRGMALGDLDNDGRADLVVSHVNDPISLLRNQADMGNHWLGFTLVGKGHRDVVGARIIVEAAGRKQTRFAKGGASYMSSNDRRHLFGLGKEERITGVTVFWPPTKDQPTAHEQHWEGGGFKIDRYWRLTEDKNAAEESGPANRVQASSR